MWSAFLHQQTRSNYLRYEQVFADDVILYVQTLMMIDLLTVLHMNFHLMKMQCWVIPPLKKPLFPNSLWSILLAQSCARYFKSSISLRRAAEEAVLSCSFIVPIVFRSSGRCSCTSSLRQHSRERSCKLCFLLETDPCLEIVVSYHIDSGSLYFQLLCLLKCGVLFFFLFFIITFYLRSAYERDFQPHTKWILVTQYFPTNVALASESEDQIIFWIWLLIKKTTHNLY